MGVSSGIPTKSPDSLPVGKHNISSAMFPDAPCLGIHGWNFCILDAFGRWYCPRQASATVGVCSYGPFFHLRFEISSPLGRCLLTGLLGWKSRFRLWGRCPWYVDDQCPAQQHQRSNMICLHVRLVGCRGVPNALRVAATLINLP